ncbi:unnamed protein product [Linum tenue]|uniref:Uncharacterized protein n=1 Tax=Linum tenue TaxID=586396 RepID=A0AAV0NTU4_9ROSI|nr:unnamed protein product [Linum tenue]
MARTKTTKRKQPTDSTTAITTACFVDKTNVKRHRRNPPPSPPPQPEEDEEKEDAEVAAQVRAQGVKTFR